MDDLKCINRELLDRFIENILIKNIRRNYSLNIVSFILTSIVKKKLSITEFKKLITIINISIIIWCGSSYWMNME